jgi:hypothetical protein
VQFNNPVSTSEVITNLTTQEDEVVKYNTRTELQFQSEIIITLAE